MKCAISFESEGEMREREKLEPKKRKSRFVCELICVLVVWIGLESYKEMGCGLWVMF